LQNVFVPVLESLLATQSNWAVHGAPNLRIAWQAARTSGLELQPGQRDADRPEIAEVLRQDMADIRSLNVRQTPTFFVNGKPLQSFGQRQLVDLVRSEVEAASWK
jgi:protein-disulfide isomerase